MSTDADRRSPLLRFLDAFLQEGNIKWILGLGMLILFGSSLMLVTTHWDSYTPVWKYVILIAYTAGVHFAGQIGYHHLALRKTGTGLMALTVLLLPLTFLAVRWVHPDGVLSMSGLLGHAGLLGLLGVNAVFTLLAARRVFRHFLRRTQSTFLISYVALCLAGAALPLVSATAAPFAALILWGLFTIGTVKVNRQVFWLTEEHRLPRICGFFPILLLGGQFLTLFLLILAPSMPWAWIGFGAVLVAVPLLLAADAWANVYEQRHGACSRPLPWNIILPLFLGVFAATAGVFLAAAGYPDTVTLVPTAALVAVVMALTARRTRHPAFVWLTLLFVLTAYQTSPVFFRGIASTAVQHGATAVHEPRLPYAFYGLTYLPLLFVTTVLSVWGRRRGDELFAPTLEWFSIGLSGLLLAAALTHAKAMLPVGLALCVLFVQQLVMFRDRRLLLPAIAAWLVTTAGVGSFVTGVLQWRAMSELPLLAWAISGGLLLVPGAIIDRLTQRFANDTSRWSKFPVCQFASLVVVIGTAAVWIGQLAIAPSTPFIAGAMIAVLMLLHAVRWRRERTTATFSSSKLNLIGETAFSFAAFYILYLASDFDWDLGVANLLAAVLTGYWIVSLALSRRPHTLLAESFARPAANVSHWGSVLLMVAGLLPFLTATTLLGFYEGPWIATMLTLAVLCHSTWRSQSAWQTVLCWIATLVCVGAAVVQLSGDNAVIEWIPAIWAGLSLLAIPVVRGKAPRLLGSSRGAGQTAGDVVKTLDRCIAGTVIAIGVLSLPFFTWPMRVAGGIGLIALWWLSRERDDATSRTAVLMLFNWQILTALLQWNCPSAQSVFALTPSLVSESGLLLAAAASVMLHFWTTSDRTRTNPDLSLLQITALGLTSVICLLSTFMLLGHELTVLQVLLAVAVFATQAALQVRLAIRRWAAADDPEATVKQVADLRDSAELRVWLAETIVAAGIGYLALFGVISFGQGWSLYLTLAGGIAAWAVGTWAGRTRRFAVLQRPLLMTGEWLPALTVVLGVYRHFAYSHSLWMGGNSLALLLAGGFYFWRGLETRRSGLLLSSAAILNVALALLWRELHWSDPQLFLIPLGISVIGLVELLKAEIPARFHDPLRYAGALMILVSPTFHIVGGSWLHLITLMIASVAITLVAMGLRVRALMYAGSAFLLADVVAMVVRGSIDNPNLLWITGIGVGAAVIGLAAYCERHREQMLQQVRLIAAKLESWE